MKILILGGTGAMGAALVPLLAASGHEVIVTSRAAHVTGSKNIRYLQGNAHDMRFLQSVMASQYDAVIDFMSYSLPEFKERYELLLASAEHYLFLSSARVYADSANPITEEHPRLLDVCPDKTYLQTDEYALTKARQEDLLRAGPQNNWTIVRPYITYSDARLQLGVFEKELWLYRALQGRTVVLPRDIAASTTTMTLGADVARGITALAGSRDAYGQTVHIAAERPLRWAEVLAVYQSVFRETLGREIKIKWIDSSAEMGKALGCGYQIKYDRLFHRTFSAAKINELVGGNLSFTPPEEGLRDCLRAFLKAPSFREISYWSQAWMDRQTGEKTPLTEWPSASAKIKYMADRYLPDSTRLFAETAYHTVKRML